MYVRNSSKKQKYLIVKLFGTRSCDGSLYVCCCRYNGCINSRDVHITVATGPIESSQGKLGQRAPSNPHRRGKNTLGRVLTTWRRDVELQGLVQRWMRDA